MNWERCYYDSKECAGELWECEGCGELFCWYHGHTTSKGANVECAACENERVANEVFRWDNPYEWLQYHLEGLLSNGEYEILKAEFLSLARDMGFDAIQEHYSAFMDEDGYFDPME